MKHSPKDLGTGLRRVHQTEPFVLLVDGSKWESPNLKDAYVTVVDIFSTNLIYKNYKYQICDIRYVKRDEHVYDTNCHNFNTNKLKDEKQ